MRPSQPRRSPSRTSVPRGESSSPARAPHLLLPADLLRQSQVGISSALGAAQQTWARNTSRLGMEQSYGHNARLLAALFSSRPVQPRGVLAIALQAVAALARHTPKNAQREDAGVLIASLVDLCDALPSDPHRGQIAAGIWVAARSTLRQADGACLEAPELARVTEGLLTTLMYSAGRPSAEADVLKSGSGRLLREVLGRHARGAGEHLPAALRKQIGDTLRAPFVDRDIVQELQDALNAGTPRVFTASSTPASSMSPARGGEGDGAAAPAAHVKQTPTTLAGPSPDDVFTYEQVHDFIAEACGKYKHELESYTVELKEEQRKRQIITRELDDLRRLHAAVMSKKTQQPTTEGTALTEGD